ncbi:AAA domain-containing protein [Daldinia decipiens]|uniref:AAA domain-containing protein n=1 Tax=Daldinia decipiens TaxID=326647 RepID=UPI0020C318AD|nr:AAA domain-containing protein [Daldinia decipiens]KAI1661834.1 AAA domain-containing protein [Daldinia decipiens]
MDISRHPSSTGHNDPDRARNDRTDLEQSMPCSLLSCLVILEAAPLSRDMDDNLLKFGRLATNQLEFKLKLIAHPYTYHLIKLTMYRNYKPEKNGMKNIWVAAMDFYFQSISHVSCTRLSQDATTSYLNQSFNPFSLYESPIQASSGSLRLSFRLSRALLYYEEARLVGETEKEQIRQLQEFADSVSADTPREITFLVGEDRGAATEQFPDRLQDIVTIQPSSCFATGSRNLNVFKAISLVSGIVSDPLARWFARSPEKEFINIRNILDEEYAPEGTRNVVRPHIPAIGSITKFFDDRQFKITQAYGTIDNATRAQILSDETGQEFQCHILVPPESLNDLGNPSTVAVVVRVSPGFTRLQSSATECEIQVLGAKRTKNLPYDVDIAKELPEVLDKIAHEDPEEPLAMNPEDFVNYCNVINDAGWIGAEKTKAIRTDLEELYSGFSMSERIVNILDLREFVAKHKNYLRMPQVKDKTIERKLATWNAQATDTLFHLFGSTFRVFLAKIPLEPTCTITPKFVPKTFEQEMEAHEEIQHPASTRRGNPVPSPLALDIYRWLPGLESPKPDSLVNHFDIFPGMLRALDGTAPVHLQSMYDDFDESKKEIFSEHMKRLPCGLAVIPGVAASGRSTFVKFYALMHLAEQSPPGSRNKVLILAEQHQILDKYELSFKRSLEEYRAPSHTFPRIERVYTTSTDIRVAVDTLSQPASSQMPNKLDTIDKHLTKPVLDEFHQLAEQDAKRAASKGFNSTLLHVQNCSEEYSSFSPSDGHVSEGINSVDYIYKTKLREADIVLATPSTARSILFRREFHPTLVIVGENAGMRELTTIMAISSFPSAKLFMLLGDPWQHVPVTNYRRDAPEAFDNQTGLSCLGRIKRGGAALPWLLYNHRQHGDLQESPSAWFYNDLMKSGVKDRYPPSVQVVRSMISELTGLRRSARVIVDVTNSHEKSVGTSFRNEYHIHCVLKILEFFINYPAFTSVDGKRPGTIAVMSYYKAQAEEIQLVLRRREVLASRLRTTAETIAKRVRVGTVDSFHGEEADLVIVDYTRTEGPGFTGNARLGATAHTRSIQGEIILMNRSSFASQEKKAKNSLTKHLYMIYKHVENERCVLETLFCGYCLDWGHENKHCAERAKCSRRYNIG